LFKGLPKGRLISTFLNSFNKTWYDMTAHVISYIRFKSGYLIMFRFVWQASLTQQLSYEI